MSLLQETWTHQGGVQETEIRDFKTIRRIYSHYFAKLKKLSTVGSHRRVPGRKYENSRSFICQIVLNDTKSQKIEDDHIAGKCMQTIDEHVRFLFDSGSDLNLIKLSALRDEVIIYDYTVYELKGITEHFIRTLGYTNLEICFRSEVRTIEFQVVGSEFPIPHERILGKPFIIGQAVIINYKTSELIFTDQSEVTL